jgi:hypothetical protein
LKVTCYLPPGKTDGDILVEECLANTEYPQTVEYNIITLGISQQIDLMSGAAQCAQQHANRNWCSALNIEGLWCHYQNFHCRNDLIEQMSGIGGGYILFQRKFLLPTVICHMPYLKTQSQPAGPSWDLSARRTAGEPNMRVSPSFAQIRSIPRSQAGAPVTRCATIGRKNWGAIPAI